MSVTLDRRLSLCGARYAHSCAGVAGETNTLLKGVTGLMFSLYQRPTNGAPYEAFPAATAGNAKFVAFEWNCSRSVYLTEKDSQSVETALVELRYQ